MNEFDDPDLGRRLRAAAGADPDVAVAQQAVHRRVARARRRRVAAVSGTAALLLLSVGVVAAVGNGRTNNHLISTADTSSLPGDTVQITSTVSSLPTTSVEDLPNTGLTTSSTVAADPTTTVAASVDTTATSSPATDTPTTPSSTGGTVTTKPKAPPASTNTTAPTVTPAPPIPTTGAVDETQTFSSVGGSVTVRLSGGRLSLVGGPSPVAGFTVDEQDVSATEVRVRFRSAGHRSKISVEIRNGRLSGNTEEVNESGESNSGSHSDNDSGSTTSEHTDDD